MAVNYLIKSETYSSFYCSSYRQIVLYIDLGRDISSLNIMEDIRFVIRPAK